MEVIFTSYNTEKRTFNFYTTKKVVSGIFSADIEVRYWLRCDHNAAFDSMTKGDVITLPKEIFAAANEQE